MNGLLAKEKSEIDRIMLENNERLARVKENVNSALQKFKQPTT